MAKTASMQFFDLLPNDLEGAIKVARAFKREGRLNSPMVRALLRTQTDYRPLLNQIVAIGVDKA